MSETARTPGEAGVNTRLAAAIVCVALIFVLGGPVLAHTFLPVGDQAASGGPNLFLGTDTVTRDGDTLAFDLLVITRFLGFQIRRNGSAATETVPGATVGSLQRVAINCGWRTVAQSPPSVAYDEEGRAVTDSGRQGLVLTGVGLLIPGDALAEAADRWCDADPRPQTAGLRDVAAAMSLAAYGTQGPPPAGAPSAPPPPLMIAPVRPPPAPPAWTGEGAPHRFVLVGCSGGLDNLLFIDRASRVRSGRTVTGLTLVLLGAEAHRAQGDVQLWRSVAAVRRTTYDCVDKTLRIEAQAAWDRLGGFQRAVEAPGATRRAQESPIVAAEIRAACLDREAHGVTAYGGLDEAWAWSESPWPARGDPWKVDCAWADLPQNVRSGLKNTWAVAPEASIDVVRKQPLDPVIAACGAPAGADSRQALLTYAVEQGALAALQRSHPLDTPRLKAAWSGVSWADRRRFARAIVSFSVEGRRFQDHLVAILGAVLGLRSPDEYAWLKAFLAAEVELNPA